MDCKRVSEVIFLFFDNEMEEDLLNPFQDHLAQCGDCNKRLQYTKKLLLVVRQRCCRCAAPDGLRNRILISFPHRTGADRPH